MRSKSKCKKALKAYASPRYMFSSSVESTFPYSSRPFSNMLVLAMALYICAQMFAMMLSQVEFLYSKRQKW